MSGTSVRADKQINGTEKKNYKQATSLWRLNA